MNKYELKNILIKNPNSRDKFRNGYVPQICNFYQQEQSDTGVPDEQYFLGSTKHWIIRKKNILKELRVHSIYNLN